MKVPEIKQKKKVTTFSATSRCSSIVNTLFSRATYSALAASSIATTAAATISTSSTGSGVTSAFSSGTFWEGTVGLKIFSMIVRFGGSAGSIFLTCSTSTELSVLGS